MSQTLPDIMDQARGRWPALLRKMGLSERQVSGRHAPCPVPGCGGKDRFRFINSEGNGTAVCNTCGGFNGIQLVMAVKGMDFKDAAQYLRELIPGTSQAPIEQKSKADRIAENKKFAQQIWQEAVPLSKTQGEAYIRNRGLPPLKTPALRFHPECKLSGVPGHETAPAVIALVSDVNGAPCGITRTYLDGVEKARWLDVDGQPMGQRKFLGHFPDGCAIRLAEPKGGTLGVCEGFETAIGYGLLRSIPAWATLATSFMEKWSPPEGVNRVFIGADNDEKFGGQASAYFLAHKLMARTNRPIVATVDVPKRAGTDWLNVYQARQIKRRAA